MKLQTKIPFNKQAHCQIDYDAKVLLIGSCFSEHIGEKFKDFKLQATVNPFGILFHPLAVETLLTRSINKDYYDSSEFLFHNEQWSSLDAHSKFNSTSKTDLQTALNAQIDVVYEQAYSATHIIITLGSSWVYRHISSDAIVANCHKLPQRDFLKVLLSVGAIAESLEAIISLIKEFNPKVSILFTVSPVRHLKDGFTENTLSKAHLISAIHQFVDPRHHIHYFPSYEIMMDELRDYRFYKADMLHPNAIAIDYIWEKFKTVWLSEKGLATLNRVAAIRTKLDHRPFNPNSEAHQAFLAQLKSEVDGLRELYPHISF